MSKEYYENLGPDKETEERMLSKILDKAKELGYINESEQAEMNTDAGIPAAWAAQPPHQKHNAKKPRHSGNYKITSVLAGGAVFAVVIIGIAAIIMASRGRQDDIGLHEGNEMMPPVIEDEPPADVDDSSDVFITDDGIAEIVVSTAEDNVIEATPLPEEYQDNNDPAFPKETSDVVFALARELVFNMWLPYISLTDFERPSFVEDNARTRLAMRWPEYHLAEIAKHPGRQIITLDSLVFSLREYPVDNDGIVSFKAMAEIRYTRVEPSVNGVNVQYDLEIDMTGDEPVIVAIDMGFAEKYRDMEEEIERRAADEGLTVELVDEVVDAAIAAIR